MCGSQNPEPEPATFLNVGLPFFAVEDGGGEFLPGDDDEQFPDSWPVIGAGEARGEVRYGSLSTMGLRSGNLPGSMKGTALG